MRRITFAALVLVVTMNPFRSAAAATVDVALGDSITFGETDLLYAPSFGDRGYVGLYADYLTGLNGGVRPNVINLAIDGETSGSFMSGVGRVPPVTGRTDAVLAAENLNYNPSALVTQNALFLSTVASQRAAGNTIGTVSISLGFNDLISLASSPNTADQLLAPTLATYRDNYSALLAEVRQSLPDTNLFLLNYYNPFPADPTNPAAPIAAVGGPLFNNTIRGLAAEYGGFYVDTFTPFVGREAQLTFQADMPAGATVPPPFGGTLPLGNVHPNAAGYQVIAAQQATSVPEPSSWASMGIGGALLVIGSIRRRRRVA